MQLSKTQVNAILQNAPIGVDKTKILDGLVQRGYTLEGVDMPTVESNIQKQETPTTDKTTKPQASAYEVAMGQKNADGTQNITSGIIPQAVDQIKKGYQQTKESLDPNLGIVQGGKQLIAGTLNEIGGGLRVAFSPIEAVMKDVAQLPGAKQALDAIKNHVINPSSEAISNIPAVQKFVQDNPNAESNIANAIAIATAFIGGKKAPEIKTALSDTATGISDAVPNIKPPKNPLPPLADTAMQAGKDLRNNIQLAVAKKNVNPQLESSTNRLFLDGTKNIKDPIATYDSYLTQSKKALADIKQDPAISVVGGKMGDAFETVIKQRQAVGKVLGDELKANGNIKINVTEPKTSLLSELKDSGLSYNPKTNSLTSFQGSKFAPEEVAMLDNFTKGVNALGDNPTVSQIDNFISKTRSDLVFTKGKSGVIGTTNAERIINGSIAKLRETLNPAINGNKALNKYWNANQTYSQLSDFVNEGSTFLGKKTLSGDFAKDASVAKSSVQSILNQGKKDFMIKLEALTGYNAIDDAVLALQAMKDAGDFRGLSLLQAMSDAGGIPTSKAGFTQKILDAAINKGKQMIAGTPEEQTRAFLQDLLNKAKINKPSTTTPTATPKGGQTTSKTSQSKKSVISPKSTTIPKKVK